MRAPLAALLLALALADVESATTLNIQAASNLEQNARHQRNPGPKGLRPSLSAGLAASKLSAGDAAPRSLRSASSPNDKWTQFMTEYIRGSSDRDGNLRSYMIDLPIAGEGSARPHSVPVLVLPVPVPSHGQECSVSRDSEQYNRYESSNRRPSYEEPRRPVAQHELYNDNYAPAPHTPHAGHSNHNPLPEPVKPRPPTVMYEVNSRNLVELFRAQQPSAPHLPPVLIRERRLAEPPSREQELPPPPPAVTSAVTSAGYPRAPALGVGYLPPARQPPPPAARAPQPPRFDRPLVLRGELTVHRADYTEPFTAWWDPSTGSSRLDLHEGATNIYRSVRSGKVHRVAMSIDRTQAEEVTRCMTMSQEPTAADLLPPILPDMHPFTFDGMVQLEGGAAERWRHSGGGRPGGRGAARGEALTYRHTLLLRRGDGNSAMPLMYSVNVDSSVLGTDCDQYMFRYHEVYEHQPDPSLMTVDVDRVCGSTEEVNDIAIVEPLREFTMMHRDPRHDEVFQKYVKEFDRKYEDSAEEAVRRNLLMQTTRFVSSGNRVGATFSMAVNFLADRLGEELNSLLGVVLDDEHFPAEKFPHTRASLRSLADDLPDEFDWRQEGGVTPVRYQGSCSSCWAFAVTGAVEGALFRQTRRLTALSEQALVDCAHPYGGRGCSGTWPSHAYDYVQDRGLPALNQYNAYQAKVLECQDKRIKPVTHISAHVNVTQHSVSALKVAIRRYAPTVVIIDGNLKSFQTYKSGVFYDDRCAKVKRLLKHAVVAVGWGSQRKEPHFILKNSWSGVWGEEGFIRVHGPSNTCGVLTLPSYPRLEPHDVRDTAEPRASHPAH